MPRRRDGDRLSRPLSATPPLPKVLGRRIMLGGLGAFLLLGSRAAAQARPMTIVTTSWYLTELLLSINVIPRAISATAAFRQRLPNIHLPSAVVDLGAVWEPNLELLQQLAPDMILLPSEQLVNEAVLSRIAPIRVVPLPDRTMTPLDTAFWTWRLVAGWLDRTPLAEAFARSVEQRFAQARTAVSETAERPVYLIDIRRGGRLVDVFGPGSILHDVLVRLGLENAWRSPVEDYGWVTTGIEHLADPDAWIVYFDDGNAAARARRLLEQSALWQALPATRAGRITAVPEVFVFGGLLTACRLADLLVTHLAEPVTAPHG